MIRLDTQMRRLDTDEKVRYRWEDCNTDKKLICIQMRRLETDEKVGYRWEGWLQMRRLDTDEKIAIQTKS